MSGDTGQLPLCGIRILDFTWAAAGPTATFLLTQMGAQCIKVETTTRGSYFRGNKLSVSPDGPRGATYGLKPGEANPGIDELNTNKLSMTVNLKEPDAIGLVKQLIAVSDAVIENFRPGVMANLGLDYSEIRKSNPAIVMVSISGHGQTGPEAIGPGFGPMFSAIGGPSWITGYPGGAPVQFRQPPDPMCGTAAALVLLYGVYEARHTGVGCWVDVSNREVFSTYIGEYLLDAAVNGRDKGPQGNRHDFMAPHNVYPCRGEGAWISIAIGDDSEWTAFCRALGRNDWLQDVRFNDGYRRWKHQEELDEIISQWTKDRDPVECMEILQQAGVAATPSYNAEQVFGDPHTRDRDSFVLSKDVEGNPWIMLGMPWKISNTSLAPLHGPHKLGQDNDFVFSELLGIDGARVAELVRSQVIV